MTLLLYTPGDSCFHRMDTVSKLGWLLAVTGMVVITASPVLNAAVFAAVLLCGLVLGRLPPRSFLRRLAFVGILAIWLVLFMAIVYPRGQTPLAQIGPIGMTREGLGFGVALGFRLLSLSAASLVFALTTNPRRLINELVVLARVPYRFAFAAYAALRFMPLLQSEAQNILHAHMVRGGMEGVGRWQRLRLVRRLTIPLLAGAIRRVQLTAIAMDSRAFGAHRTRTNIDPVERPLLGVAIALVFVVGLVGLALWQFAWRGAGLPQAPIFAR